MESDQNPEDAIFESTKPAFTSTTVGKCKTAIIDKLHHQLDHVPIGKESNELAGKAPNAMRCRMML